MDETITNIEWEPLAPPKEKVEHPEIPNKELNVLVESQNGKFCITSFAYFFGLVLGMIALLEVGLAQLGATMFALVLVVWISSVTSVFLLMLFRTYRPLAEIATWLEKNFESEDE